MTQQEQAKTFGDWAVIAIAKHYHKILKHETEVIRDKDAEELHQMRVGMRRLRSAMTAFSVAIELPEAAGEKKVGKIAKVLGELRDLDVLGETLENQYRVNLPKAEVKIFDRALKQLQKQRKKNLKRVRDILKGNEYQQLKEQLEVWLKNPKFRDISQVAIETVLPDLLLPQISYLFLHPAWLVGMKIEAGESKFIDFNSPKKVEKLLEQQGEKLHELRKEAKRVRYNMSLFEDFYEDDYANSLEKIKTIQEVLGQIQDCHVLAEFLKLALYEEIDRKMPTLAEMFQKTRFQKWHEWEELQKDLSDSKHRQELRDAVQSTAKKVPIASIENSES
ncbi:MAG: CHAD domain-containing protein [Xenococcaceae cyanobacterium]